jgi:hypothetical protein
MNEYANGKIYKVTSPDYPEGIYVGSTISISCGVGITFMIYFFVRAKLMCF